MVTTAFLSMWISNTATTALMIAVAIPIIQSFPPEEPFRKAIILGIPFASNVGGLGTPIGTPIGTPPNAITYGSGHVQVRDMIKGGSIITAISVVVITIFIYLFF